MNRWLKAQYRKLKVEHLCLLLTVQVSSLYFRETSMYFLVKLWQSCLLILPIAYSYHLKVSLKYLLHASDMLEGGMLIDVRMHQYLPPNLLAKVPWI